MTVRGLMTVEMSPFMKAFRVRSATRTMRLAWSRPFGVRSERTLASTMSTSLSCGR